MQLPETHYARVDDLRLAYHQWGDGPRMMIIPDLISNVDVMWEHELYARTLEHLGKHMTCVYFDKRGIGLSDRFDEDPTPTQRIADVEAVMDAVGWNNAHVLGTSEGAALGMLFAADHPERVDSLTVINTFMPPRYVPRIPEFIREGDPPILTKEQMYERFMGIIETWGEDASALVEWSTPSQVGNESFTRWMARLQRYAASPRDFKRQLDSIMDLDIGDAPERIKARTMVMHVLGDHELNVSFGRLLADIIPGAEFVGIEGEDHFSWIMPNWRDVTDGLIEFAIGSELKRTSRRQFGAVLFTDIVDSTKQSVAVGDTKWREVLESHDKVARELIDEHRGRVVKSTGDGLLALFDGPSEGVECGVKLCDSLRGIGVEIRAGIHAGEIEVHDDGDVSGIAVNLAARVEQQAADGELWASSTMRDLMLGGSESFIDKGEYELKGIDGSWRLFSVSAA